MYYVHSKGNLLSGTNTLERVSPKVIILNPPEKLVIETRASGGYQHYDWTRNGNPAGTANFPATLEEFSNFFEIFVREPTTTDDLGVFKADLTIAPGQAQAQDVEFCVVRYGEDHETSIHYITHNAYVEYAGKLMHFHIKVYLQLCIHIMPHVCCMCRCGWDLNLGGLEVVASELVFACIHRIMGYIMNSH